MVTVEFPDLSPAFDDLCQKMRDFGQKISDAYTTAITGWVNNCFPNDEIEIRFVNGEIKLITKKPLQLHGIAKFMSMFDYGHLKANRYMTCIVYTLWFE